MNMTKKEAMRIGVMREHLYRVCFMQDKCDEDCPVFDECEAFYKELNHEEEMNEMKAYGLFGSFIVAFKFMDADWRRSVLQFLTVANEQLLEGKNGN